MENYQNNQVERFVNQLPTPTSTAESVAQVPFRSSLELSFERERELVEHCMNMVENLEQQLGREGRTSQMGGTASALGIDIGNEKFFQKRRRLTDRYEQDVSDRVQPGTLYEQSNLSASLSSRITMQMAAKANSIFFPSEDWFSAYPVGADDVKLAASIRDHSRWKIKEQTTVRRDLRKGVEGAFVRGETVMKSTFRVRDQVYRRRGMVLVDSTDTEIRDARGEVIFDDAAWEEEMVEDESGNMVPTGVLVLSRDKITRKPGFPLYSERLVEQRRNLQSSPETEAVYFEDFLISESAKSVKDAEGVFHLYDMPVMDVASMLLNADSIKGDGTSVEYHNAINLINAMAANGPEFESGARRIRHYQNAIDADTGDAGQGNPQTQWIECYVRYDADGDGIAEEIMIMIDRKLRLPVFYDYLAMVTWDGERPFHVIRGIGIENRWHGMGSMELFSPEQEVVDLFLNRKNYRMSNKGRTTFWSPECTVEGQNDPALRLNDGETYRLAAGKRAEDALTHISLPDDLSDTTDMIEMWMQLIQIKSGLNHPGDQSAGGLPAAKTATAQNIIKESGDELFTMWIEGLDEGITSAMKSTIGLIYANMDEEEVFEYFNGSERIFDKLSPEQVRGLSINVQLKMTRDASELLLVRADRAGQLIERFYSLPPEAQMAVANGWTEMLRELKWPDADNALKPVSPESLEAQQQPVESLI